jgi:hypothetical protein
VVTGRNDDDLFFCDDTYQAVLLVDPPRPRRRQVVLARLRLANAGKGVSTDVLDKLVLRASVLRSALIQDV